MNQRFCVNTFSLYPTVSGTRTVPKAGGGSNEGALNGISKYSSLPEIVNEKLIERKAPVDDDKLFIFDVGHGSIRWVFAVMWFVIIVADNVNAWNFLLSFELQI